jgi:hypothetical protein
MVNLNLEANWVSSLPFGGAYGKRGIVIFFRILNSPPRDFSPYSSRISRPCYWPTFIDHFCRRIVLAAIELSFWYCQGVVLASIACFVRLVGGYLVVGLCFAQPMFLAVLASGASDG